jgi:hypothetical protein
LTEIFDIILAKLISVDFSYLFGREASGEAHK